MAKIRKQLIVVGDRLLVKPQEGEERTGSGLVLPATAVNEQQVRWGKVVKVGPGLPVADTLDHDEPWKKRESTEPRYIPLQAREGDVVVFLKTHAVEITYDGQRYLIVPNGAVLLLAREDLELDDNFESELDDLDRL